MNQDLDFSVASWINAQAAAFWANSGGPTGSHPQRRATLPTTIGFLALGLLGAALGARYSSNANRGLLALDAIFPHLILAGPISVACFLVGRRWKLAWAAITATAIAAATQVPIFVADGTTAPGFNLEVMTANLMLGEAAAETVVESAKARADVLAVQELTPDLLDQLSAAGLDEEFPCRAVDPRPVLAGSGCGAGTR